MPELIPRPDLLAARRVLAVQPHPDDNEIGAGATLARLADLGAQIRYVTVTDGRMGTADPNTPPDELAARRDIEADRAHEPRVELGFVGALLNPDPKEGQGPPPPPLGDRYWYPLYEALCELDVPALVHSAGCRPPARESYSLHFILEETVAVASLLASDVARDFPTLKLVVSHGGGAIPYQVGRFLAGATRSGRDFRDQLRTLHFDTCLYTRDAIELLVRAVGADRCCFGSEKPGTGSVRNPATGRWYDDIKVLVEEIEWLGDDQRAQNFERNAAALFKLEAPAPAPADGAR